MSIIIDGLDYGPAPEAFPDLSGWSAPVGPQVQSPAFVDTAPGYRTTAAGGSGWDAWLSGTATKVTDYLIARDAQAHNITAVRGANGVPVGYTQAGVTLPAPTNATGVILLVGGAVVVGLLLTRAAKG